MITGVKESKTLIKHISCNCRCKFNGRMCNSKQKWNNDKCWCECKKPIKYILSKKDYVWNPNICACQCNKNCEIGQYLENCFCIKSLVDNLVIILWNCEYEIWNCGYTRDYTNQFCWQSNRKSKLLCAIY